MRPTAQGHVSPPALEQTHQEPPAEAADLSREEKPVTSKRATQRDNVRKQSLDYVLRSGLAGGLAGCAAKTIVAPLDRVKILFQASSPQFAKYSGSWLGAMTAMKDIYRQDGSWGLFRGHSATLLRIFPYAAIKFVSYEQFRAILIKNKEQETPWRRLVSGSLAGVTSVFFTYPLEVIRVRLAFETRKDSRSSFTSICQQIYRERPSIPGTFSSKPIPPSASSTVSALASMAHRTNVTVQPLTRRSSLANFYRGFSPTVWGMLPYAGTSFLTHDTVGDLLRHPSIAKYTTIPSSPSRSNKPPPLKYWAELISGGCAGLISQTASYPLEVIRRRMQVGGAVGDGHRLGMLETIGRIWAEKGARGFYVGLTIGYLKVVPMVATSFFVYERAKDWLGI